MTKYIQIMVLTLMSALSLPLNAQHFDRQKMDSLFMIIEEGGRGMGSISIFYDGEEVYQRSYGYADLGNKVKNNSTTKYRVGSISKIITATIIMKLVEENKLLLSTTLDHFYPRIKNADKITIAHLLQHRSGISNVTSAADYLQWNTQKHTKEQLLNRIVSGGVSFEPDERFEYSNSNYVLLTFIAEEVSRKTFPELLQKMIIEPCKLENTFVGGGINTAHNEALSYRSISGWELEKETDMSIPLGAGFIVSTPFDLNVFLHCLFTGKLVKEESLNEMKNTRDKFGFGLIQVPFDYLKGYGHTGGIDGFQAMAFYFPRKNTSVSLMSNGVAYPLNDIVVGALSIYFGREYQLPKVSITLTPEELDKYPGVYSSSSFPLKITISRNGSILIGQATGQSQFPLECAGENKFRYDLARLELEFIPSENKMILRQNGMTFELKRE